MYSASVSIVLTCLLFTLLGPDHPWCASGKALTYHCACVSTWWNTVLCHTSLPSCFLGGSFNIHIGIPVSNRVRSVLDTWDVVMNDIEMLEVIIALILEVVLLRSVEGLGFFIVRWVP